MKLTYIKLFLDYRYAVEPLSDAEKGRLFMALIDYAMLGEVPQLNGNERFLFPMMRAQIDRDIKEMEDLSDERSEAGKKGAEAKQAKASKAKQNKQMPDLLSKTSKDKDKDKDKDEDYNPPKPPESDLNAFEGRLREAVEEWLRYKHERREDYKPVGRKSLLSQIASNAKEYGDEAVADVIRESMSSGYKGIVFDRLARPTYRKADKPSRDAEMDDLVAEFMRDRGKG